MRTKRSIFILYGFLPKITRVFYATLNQSSTSALQKAEALQEHNQELEKENAYLEGRIEELEKQLSEAEAELSDAQTAMSQQQTQLNELDEQLTASRQKTEELRSAYEQLLQAEAMAKSGSDASGILDGLKEQVQYFAEYAMNIYENLTNKGE